MNDTGEFMSILADFESAANNCSNRDVVLWAGCNMLYPKCLHFNTTLPLCRESCLRKSCIVLL